MKERCKVLSLLIALLLVATNLFACSAKPFERHTEVQSMLISDVEQFANGPEYSGEAELSRPLPVELDVRGQKSGYSIVIKQIGGKTQLTEKLNGQEKFLFYNSYIGQDYEWYFINAEGKKVGKENTFTTADVAPRNLYIDGVTNCRDLGGWKTIDGKRIKQGMIYRTARLNENDSQKPIITPDGIKTMTEELGIKTEIDLRKIGENGGIKQSPLGESVNYAFIPMRTGGDYLILNKGELAKVFNVFADVNNYPIVFHCSIGTDRTGVIAFLINALLGADVNSLYCDYIFSRLGTIGSRRVLSTIDKYLKEISSAGGETIAENAYNYLVAQGVPSETLDLMKELLVE